MKKTLVIGALAAALLLAIFFALNAYIYEEKQSDGMPVEPYHATLSGTFSCLPHTGTGPHTEECASGMKTEAGEYYALDLTAYEGVVPELDSSVSFTASGTVTPGERLSSDHWQKYDMEGIFSVREFVRVDQDEPPVPEPVQPVGTCYVGGCSSQLCSDTPGMVSTCEYREAYACYRTAVCERQATGQCGWTPSAELSTCLANAN